MSRLYIVGAGGHGKVVAEAAETMGLWSEIVFVDQKYPELTSCGAWTVVGKSIQDIAAAGSDFFVAIGDNATRFKVFKACEEQGFNPVSIQHVSAYVSQHSQVGNGTLICAGAVVGVGSVISECCIINTTASVDHDCALGQAVHLSPGVHLAGEVSVGDFSWLGTGVSTRQVLRIASNVIVGVGAAVVSDLDEPGTYVGIPAKPL